MFFSKRLLPSLFSTLVLGLLWATLQMAPVSFAQELEVQFPNEPFVQVNPTVPNKNLDFNDDSNQSCCSKHYPHLAPTLYESRTYVQEYRVDKNFLETPGNTVINHCSTFNTLGVAYPTADPRRSAIYVGEPGHPTTISGNMGANWYGAQFLMPSDWWNVSPKTTLGQSFHLSSTGGGALVDFHNISNFSMCLARGSNTVKVSNIDEGAIHTYQGADQVYLGGNNTNMLTRTGAGDDTIYVEQAQPINQGGVEPFRGEQWNGYQIYRTALSGAEGIDTLELQNTPLGTKWCHIGSYRLFGELFHVVEFALPPSTVTGARRQRINIGDNIEYVVFLGRRYTLQEFLNYAPIKKAADLEPEPMILLHKEVEPAKKKPVRGYW